VRAEGRLIGLRELLVELAVHGGAPSGYGMDGNRPGACDAV
jgi:hypothetical protein